MSEFEKFENLERKQDAHKHALKNLDRLDAEEKKTAIEEFEEATREAKDLFEQLNPSEQELFIREYQSHIELTQGYMPSRLEVCARVLQYLSPEWKEETDRMVQEYFLDSTHTLREIRLASDAEKDDHIRHLKTFFEEGFAGYIVLAVKYDHLYHFNDKDKKIAFAIYSKFLNSEVFTIENSCEKKGIAECEDFVKKHSVGSAEEYWEKLKTSDPALYEKTVKKVAMQLTVAIKLKERLEKNAIDCNEQTVMNQDLAYALGHQVNLYAKIPGHAALEIPGTGLVLDTYDRNIRTLDDFIHKIGYSQTSSEIQAEREGKRYYETERTKLKEDRYGLMEEIADLRLPQPTEENLSQLLIDLGIERSDLYTDEYWWEMVAKINPNDAYVEKRLGAIYQAEGEKSSFDYLTGKAIVHYEKALQIESSAQIAIHIGNLYKNRGDQAAAEKYFLYATRLDPQDESALFFLRDIYIKKGDRKKVIECSLKIYRLDKNIVSLGDHLQPKELEKALLKLLEEDSMDAKLYYELGKFYYDNKQNRKALQNFEMYEILATEKDDYFTFYFALACKDTGDLKKAREALIAEMEKSPTGPAWDLNMATLFDTYSSGQLRPFVQEYEKRYANNPNSYENIIGLAYLYNRTKGRSEKAKELAKKAFEMKPKSDVAQSILETHD